MVARMRVATSGTIAWADDYSNAAATAGYGLISPGVNVGPPVWGVLAAEVKPVYEVLFVDRINGEPAATATGTLAHPFANIPDALTYGAAQGFLAVELRLAPGFYPENIYIADTWDAVIFAAWDPTLGNPPYVGGDTITIEIAVAGGTWVKFDGCVVTALAIVSGAADHDMQLLFERTSCTSAISGDDIWIETHESTLLGIITGTTSLEVRWDGPSWAYYLEGGAPAHAPATYVYKFLDDGHDIYNVNIVQNGVGVGTIAFITLAVSPTTVQGDHAIVRVNDPTIQDFRYGVHGTLNGQVIIWLENLSRASTNFDEPAQVLIHHNDMQLAPGP